MQHVQDVSGLRILIRHDCCDSSADIVLRVIGQLRPCALEFHTIGGGIEDIAVMRSSCGRRGFLNDRIGVRRRIAAGIRDTASHWIAHDWHQRLHFLCGLLTLDCFGLLRLLDVLACL